MKKYILILALSLTSVTAVASTNDCDKTLSTASSIMTLRQQGFDVDVIKKTLANNLKSKNLKVRNRKEAEAMADKTLELLDKAYSEPLQNTLSMKYLSSKSFSKASFLNCINDRGRFNKQKVDIIPVSTTLNIESSEDVKKKL